MFLFPDDIVFDLGAHIGSYTCSVADKVKKVISFEPEPESWEILNKNAKGLKNVKLINKAVWTESKKHVPIYVITDYGRGCRNTSASSLFEKRGRTVRYCDTINFQDILDKYKPTKIKADIEGTEYVVFKEPTIIPKSVKEIIMEVHVQGYKDEKHVDIKNKSLFGKKLKRTPFKKYDDMEKYLKSQGFNYMEPDRDNFLQTKGWCWIVLFKRQK